MAITILHSPETDSASNATNSRPVNQRWIYHASSDNSTENGFRFVVNVTSTAGSPALNETFMIPANQDGEMFFNIHDLLSKKLQFEQSPETVHFLTSLAREQHLNQIAVSIKEGYIVSGVFTIDDASEVQTDGVFCFHGAYDGATGPYPPISTFQMLATSGLSSRALSDRKPNTKVWGLATTYGLPLEECIFIEVRQRDYGVLHALCAAISDVEKVLYTLVDASGTTHSEVVTLNGYRQEVVPCYPANLNAGTMVTAKPSDYSGWKYYSIQFATADETPVSAKYVFHPVSENCDHRNIRLGWRAHRGGYDYYNFQFKNFFTREVTRNRFQRDFSGISFSGTTRREYEREPIVSRFLDINTDHLEDRERDFLQWLIQSREVRIIRDNGTAIPVLVETSSFTDIAGADQQNLSQLTIRLKYAGDELDFNGWWVDESEVAELPDVDEEYSEFVFDSAYTNESYANPNTVHFGVNTINSLRVDWGDGVVEDVSANAYSELIHEYQNSGLYTVRLIETTTENQIQIDIEGQSASGSVTQNCIKVNKISKNTSAIAIGNNHVNSLSAIPIKTTSIYAYNNSLNVSDIDQLLIQSDLYLTENMIIQVQNQTPSATPSGAGITAKNNIISRGGYVLTD